MPYETEFNNNENSLPKNNRRRQLYNLVKNGTISENNYRLMVARGNNSYLNRTPPRQISLENAYRMGALTKNQYENALKKLKK